MNASAGDAQDAQDMALLAGGHDAALNRLMERHAQRLFQYLVRSLQNEEDAADLAQETFTRVYQNRRKFDAQRRFVTWLFAIATNLVRDRYRWRSRHPQMSLDAERGETEVPLKETLRAAEPAPDHALEASERAAAVRQAVAALPQELREPLLLAVYEGQPQSEIATILGCSAKAVETRLYRARQRLREKLGRMGL